MKRSKIIFFGIFSFLLFAISGAFASCVDPAAFLCSPVDFIIDHVSPADVLFATTAFPFAHVNWEAGSSNMPGTEINAWFVPLDAIVTFPALPTTPSTPSEHHTLAGGIVLAANTNVVQLYTTYKTGSLKSETEGEIDGRYFKLSVEFFHPGSKPDILNFATACINTAGVVFIRDSSSEYIVVGSPLHPVYLSPGFDSGKVGEGRKGTMFIGEAFSQLMLTKYAGSLPLTPPAS